MKLFAKIATGIFVLCLLLCLIGGVLVAKSGALNHVKSFSDGIFGIVNSAKAIEKANEERPFTPPADGCFTESQLRGYIDVCLRMKPAVEPYEKWMRDHENEPGDFKEAGEAVKFTGGLMAEMAKALEANGMSPREYAWLDREVGRARKELMEKGGSELDKDMLACLEEIASRPDISPEMRADLVQKIAGFQSRAGEGAEASLTSNAEMCSRFRAELKECEIGDLGRAMIQGFAQSPKKRNARHPG